MEPIVNANETKMVSAERETFNEPDMVVSGKALVSNLVRLLV